MAAPVSPSLPRDLIDRAAAGPARNRLKYFPILAVTGPRQSGKTTLSRVLRPELPYFSLESPDTRAFAKDDPRGFLRRVEGGAILDEVQRAPELFSFLQGAVDADRRPGRFILTGSSQFEVVEAITQSLAGRSSSLVLLPFGLEELRAAGRAPRTVDEFLFAGCFPPIHDRGIPPEIWLQDYVATYVERDVRAVLNVQNLGAFQRFLQLCAGRIGQILNVSSLAADAGITRVTANAWLSILQASHLVTLVQPWFTNLSKRLIKTPKLYFVDAGLAGWLLGVRRIEHLTAHPLRGALFENAIVMEMLKAQTHRGRKPSLYFLRDKEGHEIDIVIETAPGTLQAIEIKSGETVASDFFTGLEFWRKTLARHTIRPWLIYAGSDEQPREKARVLPWNRLAPLIAALE